MYKVFWQILIIIIFLLAACGQSTLVPVIDSARSTPSPFPTATQTTHPTATPTASVTPLPTIPAFTPTFDVSTIITVTPAPKAECPKINPDLQPNLVLPEELTFEYPFVPDFEDKVIEFLNKGGDYRNIQKELQKKYERSPLGLSFLPLAQDITGDSVPELIFRDFGMFPIVHIFSCTQNRYMDFTPLTAAETAWPVWFDEETTDLNVNGIPEILLGSRNWVGIYEWNGEDFKLLNPGMSETGEVYYDFLDVDNNQTKEVILKRGYPHDEWLEFPWRRYTVIFSWNGQIFVEYSKEFDPPEYQFQAVQDADQKTNNVEYEKAIHLYQEVIFNNKLEWWSPERREFLLTFLHNPNTPNPEEMKKLSGLTEYPRLATYAYYRIMLIHLVQGSEAEATATYNTLQQTFSNDPYGRPYVEMATAFWDAYQSTHTMYDGCAAAIQYAAENPDILIPLGSDYHGSQSHIYVPADVCPFR